MKKGNLNIRLDGQRDLNLLVFLWRFKVATTATLTLKFFPAVAPATAYRRLWRLENGGFITSRADKAGRKYVWLLDKRGYEAIRGYLPYHLVEDGYKSEHIGHDLVATAFHLGDWLIDAPGGVRIFTEQQVRRYRKDGYPEYVCRYRPHVPDGYTFIPSANSGITIAFEAELNAKGQNDYSCLYRSYGAARVDYVFWLAPKLTTAKRIWRYVQKGLDNDKPQNHNFITYPGFLRKGWGAEIVCGTSEGRAMREVIEKLSQNQIKTESKLVLSHHLLNVSKTPFKSKSYKYFESGDFAK